ncbi:hypothetical protein TeGR_g3956, partial [Tetraparma gracilis]
MGNTAGSPEQRVLAIDGVLLEVCSNLTFDERFSSSLIGKRFRSLLASPGAYQLQLERLHIERGIYYNSHAHRSGDASWKEQFQSLYK